MEVKFLIGKKQDYENTNAEIEENILKEFAKKLSGNFTIEHNSSDYTTLKNETGDIVRLKYGTNAKWIKIIIVDRDKYMNDPLFNAQTNKKELFWKSKINTLNDLDKYIDIINEQIDQIKTFN